VSESADVLVVGGRCAGATLATWLARAGVSVIVADRARFPSDTLSTHVFQGGGIASLRRLGALDDVLATGAPPVSRGRISMRNGDDRVEAVVPMPAPAPGLPALLCVRRVALDEVLHRIAAEAGAEMLDGWRARDLLRDEGRVVGARLQGRDGDEREVRARLVVGADGRNSMVARQAGARRYSVLPMERFGYFAYYEGVVAPEPETMTIVRDERLFGFAVPADAGLFLACLMPPAAGYREFMSDVEVGWEREVGRLDGVGELVATGRRVGRPRGLHAVDTYLRDGAGAGWALIGDAGHFKDPAPGQGIADAFRQAEHLAEAIDAGLDHGDIDRRLRAWWRWRDRDALQRHTWAHGFGAVGAPQHLLVQIVRDTLGRPDGPKLFWGPSMQTVSPREAANGRVLLRAARRSVARNRLSPSQAARELRDVARREGIYRRTRRSARRPAGRRLGWALSEARP
jgi:2-polyprenyl-6-methoxyphenol hydroxylase-like FAD-dependent oxidoreductase